jgi:hypothetical protein
MKPSNIFKFTFIFFILFCVMYCRNNKSESLPVLTSFDFEDGKSEGWRPNFPKNWEVVDVDGSRAYHLSAPGESGEISAPTSWAVLTGHDVTSFEFSGRFLCAAETDNPNRDLCVFFHYQDPVHFYYAHFSASSDERHNIIGLVDGSDRIKINLEPPGESVFRLIDKEWHNFKITYDSETGAIRAYLDDMETPIVTASGSVLGHGLVGIGSYDDTGYFDDLILKGKTLAK